MKAEVKGLVSTVIPVHNRATLLLEAVQSVLQQTYRPIDIIIVDDGSTDDTPLTITELVRNHQEISSVSQDQSGPGAARQRGLQRVEGEFVQFLDSDDLLYPEKFTLQVAALRSQPEAGVAYGKTRNTSITGDMAIAWKKTGQQVPCLFPSILEGRIWDTSTPLYRTSIVNAVGGWSTLINEEDWEFDCRIGVHGVQLAWVDEWVSEQRSIASNRASAGGSSDPEKLKDRAKARQLILNSALKAEVPVSAPEFGRFLRYSFLVARQCALVGLEQEASELLYRLHSIQPRPQLTTYIAASRFFGIGTVTRVTESLYRLKRGVSVRRNQ